MGIGNEIPGYMTPVRRSERWACFVYAVVTVVLPFLYWVVVR